jgi:DNA helicase-2/ATP-dependent DNA helicase PcrA
MTSPNFKDLLNPVQYEAVTHEGGPLLIVAGAGSGKTRTLVYRVAHLVDSGVRPERILLLTFTRKASSEMLERAASLVAFGAGRVAGGTFHSLANKLLRKEAHHLGYGANFGIMDQDDSENMLVRILDANPDLKRSSYRGKFPKKGTVAAILSQARNKETGVKSLVLKSHPYLNNLIPNLEKLQILYEEEKLNNGVMDFDDLLINLARVMIENESVRERLASYYDHVLVDEYQDTNLVQARITWLLGKDHRNVTAVGDEAQSIYSFRGAEIKNIMEFPKLFDPAKILRLEENYRSYSPILDVANGVLESAAYSYKKKLRAVREGGVKPVLFLTPNVRTEGEKVAGLIEDLLRGGEDPKNIAVLFRAAAHSFELELELTRRSIAFTKYGGRKFLESAHVKDFLSILRASENPSDETSLIRVLRLLKGVGAAGAAKTAEWVAGDKERLGNLSLSPIGKKRDKEFLGLTELFRFLCQDEEKTLKERLDKTLEFYLPLVPFLYPDNYQDRKDDVLELYAISALSDNLPDFLADVTLDPPNSESGKAGDARDRRDVTLSTIHSAKGLEWRYVFLISATDGRFPHYLSSKNPDNLEEERRLMYVAVTRAMDELYISSPEYVETYGHIGDSGGLSRFLSGFSEEYLDSVNENDLEGDDEDDDFETDEQDFYDGDDPLSFSDDGSDGDFNLGEAELRKFLDAFLGPSKRSKAKGSKIPKAQEDEEGEIAPSHPLLGKGANSPKESPNPMESRDYLLEPLPGQKVSHPSFGEGKVISVKGERAVIEFETVGRKNIMIKYGKLRLIESP